MSGLIFLKWVFKAVTTILLKYDNLDGIEFRYFLLQFASTKLIQVALFALLRMLTEKSIPSNET